MYSNIIDHIQITEAFSHKEIIKRISKQILDNEIYNYNTVYNKSDHKNWIIKLQDKTLTCSMRTASRTTHFQRGTRSSSALSASMRYHRKLKPVMVSDGSRMNVRVRPKYLPTKNSISGQGIIEDCPSQQEVVNVNTDMSSNGEGS